MKMKSVSSTLGRQRMMSDYNKARQIKDRITRFSKENDKVTLKYAFFKIDLKNISAKIKA